MAVALLMGMTRHASVRAVLSLSDQPIDSPPLSATQSVSEKPLFLQQLHCCRRSPTAAGASFNTASQGESGNLLVNPDFEEGFDYPLPCCNNIAVPIGWNVRWYTDTPPGGNELYKFKQPEVKIIDKEVWPFCCQLLLPPRINTGRYAIESFTLFANQDTSFYQQVGDIPIGAVVTASAWVHAWVSSCDPAASITPVVSLQGPTNEGCPDNFWPVESNRMLVGIDPHGGVDPRASTVVWNWNPDSPPWWGPYDTYSPTLPAVTTARAHTVTLFLRGVTVNPVKHDNFYFDTTRLTYSFPLSAGVEQDLPWPLPATITIAVQAPVSFTQVNVAVTGPDDSNVPATFAGTTEISPAYLSRWRFSPAVAGEHVFTLAAYELLTPFVQTIGVKSLRVDVEQDRLLPPGSVLLTDSVSITLTLHSPVSLTNVTAVLTNPLGAQAPITLVSAGFVDPTYAFRWRFAPVSAGLHTLHLAASEFTQPLIQAVLAATARVYLPTLAKNAINVEH